MSINEGSIGSNPMFTFIELAEHLMKLCQKQMAKKEGKEVVEEAKTESKQASGDTALDKKMAKGALILAPSKDEKEQSVFTSTHQSKKKGRKQKAQQSEPKDGPLDFSIVKKFSTLKISAPMNPEEFERAHGELQEIKESLIYWGKIIQR